MNSISVTNYHNLFVSSIKILTSLFERINIQFKNNSKEIILKGINVEKTILAELKINNLNKFEGEDKFITVEIVNLYEKIKDLNKNNELNFYFEENNPNYLMIKKHNI